MLVVATELAVLPLYANSPACVLAICGKNASLFELLPNAHGSPVLVPFVGLRTTKSDAPLLNELNPEPIAMFWEVPLNVRVGRTLLLIAPVTSVGLLVDTDCVAFSPFPD